MVNCKVFQYDSFILREIAEQPEQFKMAIVIGNVLGKYQLGISDVWISNRIDKMLEDGVLEIIQDAPKGETNYRRNEIITTARTAATWKAPQPCNSGFFYRFFLWLIGVPIFFDFLRIRISQRNSSSDRFL